MYMYDEIQMFLFSMKMYEDAFDQMKYIEIRKISILDHITQNGQ